MYTYLCIYMCIYMYTHTHVCIYGKGIAWRENQETLYTQKKYFQVEKPRGQREAIMEELNT